MWGRRDTPEGWGWEVRVGDGGGGLCGGND